MLCPRCHDKNCKFEALSNSCFHAHLIYLFDNPLVITFAGLMSIWCKKRKIQNNYNKFLFRKIFSNFFCGILAQT